jgi:hypothetical protein
VWTPTYLLDDSRTDRSARSAGDRDVRRETIPRMDRKQVRDARNRDELLKSRVVSLCAG